MAMIKLTGINKIYRTNEIETLALENVNLDVAKGEFVSIMGPSGCGKSTLLNIMGLLDAPSSGKIEINGTSVESMKDKELAAFRNKTLGFVFQSFHLIKELYLEPSKQLQTMKNTWRQTFVYQLLLDFNTSNLLFGGSQKSAYLCNAFLPRRILRAFILPSRGQS